MPIMDFNIKLKRYGFKAIVFPMVFILMKLLELF